MVGIALQLGMILPGQIALQLRFAVVIGHGGRITLAKVQLLHGRQTGIGCDTRQAFLKLGPDELRSQFIRLYAQTVSLEFQLMGDSDTAPTLSIAEWQIKARECLENTDKAIHKLLAGIPRQPR